MNIFSMNFISNKNVTHFKMMLRLALESLPLRNGTVVAEECELNRLAQQHFTV